MAELSEDVREQLKQPSFWFFATNMEDGSTQTLIQDANSDIRAGDRVRVENGIARRY